MGLPIGILERAKKRSFGTHLKIYFISRIDQIFFKLYASIDRGGYHIEDLLMLHPIDNELKKAVEWTVTHDVSEGFRQSLILFFKEINREQLASEI